MAGNGWREKLRRVPMLGGAIALIGIVREVYETIGWTDPAYHSVRSGEERLAEARKVAEIGAATPPGPQLPAPGPDSSRPEEQD